MGNSNINVKVGRGVASVKLSGRLWYTEHDSEIEGAIDVF